MHCLQTAKTVDSTVFLFFGPQTRSRPLKELEQSMHAWSPYSHCCIWLSMFLHKHALWLGHHTETVRECQCLCMAWASCHSPQLLHCLHHTGVHMAYTLIHAISTPTHPFTGCFLPSTPPSQAALPQHTPFTGCSTPTQAISTPT